MKKLNFGCGRDIRKGWDNCDIQKAEGIIYCDGNHFPYPFDDNTYDYIYLREVLIILDDVEKVLFELWRIAKPNAIIEIEVPYANNIGAHNDLKVKHYFNDEVFRIFVEERCILHKKHRFAINLIRLEPTKIGRFMPESLRKKLSLFISGLISKVHIRLRVIK